MTRVKALPLLRYTLLAVAVCAIYSRALNAPFIYDDAGSIADNRSIFRLWPLVGDAEHPGPLNPSGDLPISGRPLVNLSLAINYHFCQNNPLGYHVFNLIVHVLSAWLLMAIVEHTLNLEYFEGRFARASAPLAFAVALLWAVHPLQTETVVYITQRTELMVGFFYLATLYASLRYWQSVSAAAQNTWLALAALACMAGMACKEVMVTAPVIVLLFERTIIAGTFRRALQKSWPLYVGLIFGWGLLLFLNHSAPRGETAGFHLGMPAATWWYTQCKVFWMYLRLTIWPWPLAIHYQMPYLITLSEAWPWVLPTALTLIATLIFFWRRSAIGFVGAWVLIILSPTFVVPIITEVAAERRMYLPLAAIAALVVVGGCALALQATRILTAACDKRSQWDNRRAAAIAIRAAIFLAVVFSMVSIHRLAAYDKELTLWQDVVASQPDNFIAHCNFGNQLAHAGRIQEAMSEHRKAMQLSPEFPDIYDSLGNSLLDQGKIPEAIKCFEQALQLKPDYSRAHNDLGVALADSGKFAEAIQQYQASLKINPHYVDAYNNLGNVLVKMHRPQEAAEQFTLALQVNPDFSLAHAGLAGTLVGMGQYEEAIKHCQKALQIRPDYAEAHCNLGIALGKVGRITEAIMQFDEALRLKPDDYNTHYNLGIVLYEAGQPQLAVEQFQHAVRLEPANAQAYYNLGSALLQTGKVEDAIQNYQTAVKLKPDYAEAHNNLGSALLRAGRLQEAIEQYEQTVRLMPNHPKAHNNLAKAYAQMHRSTEAIAAAQRALELARSTGQANLAEQIEDWLKDYRVQPTEPRGKATSPSHAGTTP